MWNMSSNSSAGQYSVELSSTVQHLSSTEQASGGVAKSTSNCCQNGQNDSPIEDLNPFYVRWLQCVHDQIKNLSKTHYCTYFTCGTIATAARPLIGPSTNQREARLGNWQQVLCTVLLITGQHCSVVLITWTAKASSVLLSTAQYWSDLLNTAMYCC